MVSLSRNFYSKRHDPQLIILDLDSTGQVITNLDPDHNPTGQVITDQDPDPDPDKDPDPDPDPDR